MLRTNNVLGATSLEQLVGAIGNDLRGKMRFAADTVPIAVAPYVTIPLPNPEDLRQVDCKNVSRQGIAFLWPEKPPGRFMLIRLGRPAEAMYLTARVAGTSKIPGQSTLIVRCQFIRELAIEARRVG